MLEVRRSNTCTRYNSKGTLFKLTVCNHFEDLARTVLRFFLQCMFSMWCRYICINTHFYDKVWHVILQIYLPHGTLVEVYYFRSKWWSTMNIQIYPSPEDMGKLEGLCGNFNGDRSDDLRHSDGTLTQSSNWYWWWWWDDPNEFSSSWG